MRLFDYIRSAQTNLLRSPLRTILTMLAILIGTFTMATTTALGGGVREYIDQQTRAFSQPDTVIISPASDIGESFSGQGPSEYDPNKKSASLSRIDYMDSTDLDIVSQTPNITAAYLDYPASPEYVQYEGSKKYRASVQSFYERTDLALAAGELIKADDLSSVLLPYTYATALGFSTPEQALGKQVTVNFVTGRPKAGTQEFRDIKLTVKGVLVNTILGQSMYISHRLTEETARFQQGEALGALAAVASTKQNLSEQELAEMKKTLSDKGYSTRTYEDGIGEVTRVIDIAQLVLSIFSAIALLAATLGIVNTLLMAVLERTREIGLMKALGMRRRGIFAIFTMEAMSIGFWGGLLGVLLALLVGTIANTILSRTILKNLEGFTLLSYPPLSMLYIILGAMAIGLLAGALPALRAARLNPIEALRSE